MQLDRPQHNLIVTLNNFTPLELAKTTSIVNWSILKFCAGKIATVRGHVCLHCHY
jgi:hypothetical protein